jgi:hypothetical protein
MAYKIRGNNRVRRSSQYISFDVSSSWRRTMGIDLRFRMTSTDSRDKPKKILAVSFRGRGVQCVVANPISPLGIGN